MTKKGGLAGRPFSHPKSVVNTDFFISPAQDELPIRIIFLVKSMATMVSVRVPYGGTYNVKRHPDDALDHDPIRLNRIMV